MKNTHSYQLASFVAFFLFCALLAPAYAVSLPNPIGVNSFDDLIANIISSLLGLSGSIALLFFVYGGFVWMTSSGSQDRVSKGKNILVWATIGMVIVFASYAIINQVLGLFGN